MDDTPHPGRPELTWLVDKPNDPYPERDHMLTILYRKAPLLTQEEAEAWMAERRKRGWVAAWAYEDHGAGWAGCRDNPFYLAHQSGEPEEVARREKLVRATPYLRLLLERPEGLEVARIEGFTGRAPARFGYGTEGFAISKELHPIVMHAARGTPALALLTKWALGPKRAAWSKVSRPHGGVERDYKAWLKGRDRARKERLAA